MISDATSNRTSKLQLRDKLFSLPVLRLLPKEWHKAAVQANYQAAAFALMLNLSPRQLLRQCQRMLNCPTKALLTHLQMLAAVELLLETPRGKEVGVRLGFQSSASFGRRFKAYFGLTPWEFAHRTHHAVP